MLFKRTAYTIFCDRSHEINRRCVRRYVYDMFLLFFPFFFFFFWKPFNCQPLKTNCVAHTTPSNKETGRKRSGRDGRDDNENALNLSILCVGECDFVRDTIPGQTRICYNGIQKKEKIFIVFFFQLYNRSPLRPSGTYIFRSARSRWF